MAPPRLFIGPITGKVYVTRRYRELEGNFVEITGEKIDITTHFEDTVLAYLSRLGRTDDDAPGDLEFGLDELLKRYNARADAAAKSQ